MTILEMLLAMKRGHVLRLENSRQKQVFQVVRQLHVGGHYEWRTTRNSTQWHSGTPELAAAALEKFLKRT